MTVIVAAIGANALWLLYVWLLSAIASSAISNRKGYGEKWGLGTGLLLSFIGVIVWLLVPAKPTSKWAAKRRGEDPDKVTTA
ncbi:MAG: hypothetical protein QOH62_3609 [Solirubrobacteraceae bacterium]|jgi:hypothetical protein|nr:hypothetical protein [Solirubrobacteraceae bacterium]